MKTVGICGKIGSGKSAVGVILEQQGALVLDLDMEMHALYAESRELRNRIEARFGSGCIQNGMVNRVALASLVFREPAALQDLESLVYPLLRRRVEEKLEIAKDHAHLLRMAAVEVGTFPALFSMARNLRIIASSFLETLGARFVSSAFRMNS